MKILFTGSSSFTGLHLLNELQAKGCEVECIFTHSELKDYEGRAGQRVNQLPIEFRKHFGVKFGSNQFVDIVREGKFDCICHHGAEVTNYRSPDFDAVEAVGRNTKNLQAVLDACKDSGCSAIALTSSFFEQGEGVPGESPAAFSPYGLSKGMTSSAFQYYCKTGGIRLGRFVIPNPFGSFENQTFTSYIVSQWLAGKEPSVNAPHVLRDNIHVRLLAEAYANFIGDLVGSDRALLNCRPSGYVMTQGEFSSLFAKEFASRANIPCPLAFSDVGSAAKDIRVNKLPNSDSSNCPLPEHGVEWDVLVKFYMSDQF